VGPAASAATFTAALALGGAAAYWPGGGAGSSSPRGGRRYDGGLTSGDPRRAATDALLWTTAIGYVLQVLTGHAFTAMGAKVNAEIAAGQVYRLVTPLLLHGSPLHLLVNCMSLHNLGPVIERQFGRDSFVGLYLASGIGGNYLSYKMCPNNAVGASGAIFGLVGAMGVYLHRHSDLFGAVGDRQLQSLLGSVGVNALFGMMSRRIDNWAHLGGFLTGAFVAAAFGPNLIVLNAGSHAVSEGGRRRVVNRPVLQTYASEFAREFRRK
jgi:uridine nucleosidase